MCKYKAKIILGYQGKSHTFLDEFAYGEKDKDNVEFNWKNGNFACDCNKSKFIGWYCDGLFAELQCGDTIELTSFEHVDI